MSYPAVHTQRHFAQPLTFCTVDEFRQLRYIEIGRLYRAFMSTHLDRSLFAAGVFSAVLYAFLGPALPIQGGGEMVAIGQNLARCGVFGHPFVLTFDTGPTAVVPPLYPAFIGILIRLLGGSMAWIVMAAGVILMQGLQACLLPRLSQIFYGDPKPGICAAILCILLPVYSWMPYWDAMYTAAGLMLFCLASQRWVERGWPWYRLGAVCGLCAGVLALANPASLSVRFCGSCFC